MAAPTVVETPSSPRLLPAAQIGRMIVRLRSHWKYRHTNRHFYEEKIQEKQWHTDADIRAALGLTPEQFKRCLEEYEKTMPGRRWDAGRVEVAFNAFVNKEKRWPRSYDCTRWRENGLPYFSTMQLHYRFQITPNSAAFGLEGLVENYCSKWPRKVTPQMAFSIRNLTTRRNIITQIGAEKLIKEGGGSVQQQDDFGILWRLTTDGVDPHMQYVEVVNKSPRVDEATMKVVTDRKGNPVFDHYFLRVPHGVRTARAAVAWTLQVPELAFTGFAAES